MASEWICEVCKKPIVKDGFVAAFNIDPEVGRSVHTRVVRVTIAGSRATAEPKEKCRAFDRWGNRIRQGTDGENWLRSLTPRAIRNRSDRRTISRRHERRHLSSGAVGCSTSATRRGLAATTSCE